MHVTLAEAVVIRCASCRVSCDGYSTLLVMLMCCPRSGVLLGWCDVAEWPNGAMPRRRAAM